jgi:hypothetical protein
MLSIRRNVGHHEVSICGPTILETTRANVGWRPLGLQTIVACERLIGVGALEVVASGALFAWVDGTGLRSRRGKSLYPNNVDGDRTKPSDEINAHRFRIH